MTLTSDRVILHTFVHYSSTSTYMPNFIEIKGTFCGRTFDTHFIRSTQKKTDPDSPEKWPLKWWWWQNHILSSRTESRGKGRSCFHVGSEWQESSQKKTYFSSRCNATPFSWLSWRQIISSFCIASTSSCRKSRILPSGFTLRVRAWMDERSRSTSRCATSRSLRRDASDNACDRSCTISHHCQPRRFSHYECHWFSLVITVLRTPTMLIYS